MLLVNILIKPVWIFFIDRNVQNHFGNEVYGNYMALVNLAMMFQILMDFGLNTYNTLLVSKNPSEVGEYFKKFLITRIIMGCAYAIISIVVALSLGFGTEQLILLGGILAIQGLNNIVQLMRSSLSGLQRFRQDAILSSIDKIILVVLCGLFLFVPFLNDYFNLKWFVAMQQFSYVVAVALGIYFLLKSKNFTSKNIEFDAQEVLKLLKKSAPYALLVLLMGLYMRLDIILLRKWSIQGSESAGYYYAAFRLLDAGNIFGVLLASILLPIYTKEISNSRSVQNIVDLANQIALPLSFLIAIVSCFWGHEIMSFLMKDVHPQSGTVLGLLMCAYPAYMLMYIYSTLMTANNLIKTFIVYAFVTVILTLAGNYILIPKYGMVGTAYSTLACIWIIASLCTLKVINHNHLKISRVSIFKYLLLCIALILGAFIVDKFKFSWLIKSVFIGLEYLCLVFLLKIISISSIKVFLNYKKR